MRAGERGSERAILQLARNMTVSGVKLAKAAVGREA